MKTSLKRFKYFIALGFAAVLVLSSLLAVVIPDGSVSAQATGEWVDRETIRYNGQTFKVKTVEGKLRWVSTQSAQGCSGAQEFDFIEFPGTGNPTVPGTAASPGYYDDFSFAGGTRNVCGVDDNNAINLANTNRATLTPAQAQCEGQPPVSLDGCIQRAVQNICSSFGTPTAIEACIANQSNPSGGLIPGGTNGNGANPTGPASESDTNLDCAVGWNPLTWVVCPFISLINTTLSTLDKAIIGLLTIEQDKIFNADAQPGAGYYEAWQAFRGIAVGLLIVGALVMIIGQGLGFEILDAYTVKKVVPRLIVATIGIALSWELMEFAVEFTNDLGLGIRNLIYYPFREGDLAGNDAIIGGGESSILFLLSGGALLGLGLLGILSFGLTALLGIFIAFMVLVFRQLIIVVLVLAAPIAIACYILPNTQSIWKLWYESFTKALMMFPIIMAFLAVGRVLSFTSSSPDATFIGQIIAFLAYVLPYFLIPLTFRFAGGALRTIGGFTNDTGKGGFDRLKKYRQNTTARRGHEWRGGSLYQDKGLGKVINTTGRRAAVGFKDGKRFGYGKTGQQALGLAQQARIQDTLKNNAQLNELKNQDDANAVLALSGGSDTGGREALRDLKSGWQADIVRKRTSLDTQLASGSIDQVQHGTASRELDMEQSSIDRRAEDAFASAQAVGFNRENAAAALQTVAQNKSRAIGAGGFDVVQRGINRLSGDNSAASANAAFSYQYFSREAGRADLGGNWIGIDGKAGSLETTYARQQAAGHSDFTGASREQMRSMAARDVVALDGMGRTEVPALVRGHGGQMKQNASTIKRMFEHGDDEQKQLAAIRLIELQKNMSYASGDNQKIINDLMRDVGVDYTKTGAKSSVEEQVAQELSLRTGTRSTYDATALTRAARTYDRESYDREIRS